MAEYTANTLATFTLGDTTRNVLEYSYQFDCPTDKENQLSGIPRGGRLTVKLDAPTKTDNSNKTFDLFSHMINRTNVKDVTLTIMEPAAPKTVLKTLVLGDSYIVKYKENWKDIKDGKGESSNTEEIEITWKTFTWYDGTNGAGKTDGVTYDNYWPGSEDGDVAKDAGMSLLSSGVAYGTNLGGGFISQV